MKTLIDDVVKHIDKGVFNQFITHFLELKVESSESFRNLSQKRVRLSLIFLIWTDKVLVKSTLGAAYGLSEERSKPSLEISVLLS